MKDKLYLESSEGTLGFVALRCYFLADISSRSPRFIESRIRRNEAASAVSTFRSNSTRLRLLEVLATSSSTWQPRSTQKAQPAANQSRKLQDTAVRKNAQSKIICIFFAVLPVLMKTLADVSVRYNASF